MAQSLRDGHKSHAIYIQIWNFSLGASTTLSILMPSHRLSGRYLGHLGRTYKPTSNFVQLYAPVISYHMPRSPEQSAQTEQRSQSYWENESFYALLARLKILENRQRVEIFIFWVWSMLNACVQSRCSQPVSSQASTLDLLL